MVQVGYMITPDSINPNMWRHEYLNTPGVVKNEQTTAVPSGKVTYMTRTILWDNSSLRKGIKIGWVHWTNRCICVLWGLQLFRLRTEYSCSRPRLFFAIDLSGGNIRWRVCHTHSLVGSQAGRESHYNRFSNHRALNKWDMPAPTTSSR